MIELALILLLEPVHLFPSNAECQARYWKAVARTGELERLHRESEKAGGQKALGTKLWADIAKAEQARWYWAQSITYPQRSAAGRIFDWIMWLGNTD